MKPKPRPIQAETQGWSKQRSIRPIQAEFDADKEDQQRVNEKRRGWSDLLKKRVNEEWERRKKEAETRERKNEKNWDQ